MHKVLREISTKRIIKYSIFSLWQWVFELLPFHPLRIFWMRLGGAKIGKACIIDKIDFINLDRTGLKGLEIGQECFIGRGAMLDLAGRLILGNQVTVSSRAILLTHFSVGFSNHPLIKKYPKCVKKTILENGCFVSVGSIIFPGIKLGEQSIIAAGSIVRTSVPANSLAAGVPAKIKAK